MEIFFFLSGAFISAFIVIFTIKGIANLTDYKLLSKPYDLLLNTEMPHYQFLNRENSLVRFFILNHIIIMNITDKTLTIVGANGYMLLPHQINKQKMSLLYDMLINNFRVQIFDDVTQINNMIISNNLLRKDGDDFNEFYGAEKPQQHHEPSIDEILEKIKTVGGREGLTPMELKILKDFRNN